MSAYSHELVGLTLDGRPLAPSATGTRAEESTRRPGWLMRRSRVLRDVLFPRPVARGVPFEYVIEVTSKCNLLCPMCPREISPSVGNKDLDLDTFDAVLDRIRHDASFVWLAGLGEPMMSKHFIEMIRRCKEAGIATGASTNGTFLNKTWQKRLLDIGLDLLIVSFDGANKETYEKIRVGADFDKVCTNVRDFAAMKVERRAEKPWLILQMIELAPTRGQGQAFRDLWNIPGVDAVRVKKDELQFEESLAFEGQRKRDGGRTCPYLWRGTMYIHSDGAVSPCCYGHHDKSFGRIQDAPVSRLWNGRKVRALRDVHLAGKGGDESFCKNCHTFQPGKVSTAASVLVPSLTQKKYADVVEKMNRWVRFME